MAGVVATEKKAGKKVEKKAGKKVGVKASASGRSAKKKADAVRKRERIFLVVVDDSKEMRQALYYACLRAGNTDGRVALLYARPKAEMQPWLAVGDMMREESREMAEDALHKMSKMVQEWSGKLPVFYMREGNLAEEMVRLIEEEKSISILVLAASEGRSPGQLISYILNKTENLRTPVTVVPGGFTKKQIEELC